MRRRGRERRAVVMIALIPAFVLAVLKKERKKIHEFVRNWGFYTILFAALGWLWITAVEAYALLEMLATQSQSSVIATVVGKLVETFIARGVWADFAAGAFLVFLSLVLEELQDISLPRLRRQRRPRPCFVVWENDRR